MDIHNNDILSRPAEEFGNDGLIEELWAVKAHDHGEVYFNLLCSVPPEDIRLTPHDDLIYSMFRQDFPEMKVDLVTDDNLKSPEAKVRWRAFAERFSKLEDYSLGTLLRSDASKEFTPENSLLVVRIQFLAIEIARNREGANYMVHQRFKPKPKPIEEAFKVMTNVESES